MRKNTAQVEHWPQKALGSGFVSIIHYESDPPPHPHPRVLTLTVAVQGPGRSRLTPLHLYHFQENYSNCLVGILSNFKKEGKCLLLLSLKQISILAMLVTRHSPRGSTCVQSEFLSFRHKDVHLAELI